MKRSARTRIACWFVALAVACAMVPGAGVASAAGDGPLLPVVLVHGFTSGPEVWEAGRDGGLYADLIRHGYRPGVTLFRLDYANDADADPWSLAGRLGQLVDEAARHSPDGRVDIVSFSSGSLVAREYVERLAPAQRVRTLVMIAPPNRGSFAADSLRVALFSGALAAGVSKSLAQALAGAVSGAQPDLIAAVERAPGESEVDHVRYLATHVWIPEMAWFVVQERLLPEEERPLSQLPFAEWMRKGRGEVWRALFAAQGAGRRDGSAWQGLSEAYELALAFEVADQAVSLAQGLAEARPALPDPLGLGAAAATGLAGGDWRTAAWRAVVAWLQDWAVRAGRALWKPALTAGARWAGAAAAEKAWGVAAGSPVLARMVTEEVPLPGAGDAPGERVAANVALAAANADAARIAPGRATRYVVIAGQTWNLWGRFARVGANDGFVETSATRVPAGPLDVRRVVGGAWSAVHVALPGARAVREAVLESLDPFRGARALAPGRSERIALSDSRPALLRVGSGHVSAEASAPAGWHPVLAWVALDGKTVRPLPLSEGRWDGVLPAGYLAARLQPDDGASGARSGLGQLRIAWDAGAAAGSPGAGGTGASDTAAPAPGEKRRKDAASAGAPPEGSSPRGDPARSEAGGPDGALSPEPDASGGAPSEDLPLIQVVLHSRLTTDKKPRVTRHARWTWSFGDGQTAVDDDASHVVTGVEHVFAAPGTYRITARSLAEDGRVIRELTWTQHVERPGETHEFHAETIRPPDVALRLEGPQAWIVGRPATFQVRWAVQGGGPIESVEARAYPGERFRVQWARPGNRFSVRAAVTLKIRYRFPDGHTFTAYDTHVTETFVDVYATSVVR